MSSDSLVGRSLQENKYQLREIIGRGGMATVYRAYAEHLRTDVAIKVLMRDLAMDLGFRARFQDEASNLAGLHHPNLLEVHWYGEEGELIYIVSRLVRGGTLRDRLIAAGGPLDLVSTARLISQVAAALQHAHDRGLVHLDVKPGNILLGAADWPLLCDFGITRAVAQQSTSAGGLRLAGTPAYMSPEHCRGDMVDGRTDQYALAVTTFELLTGTQPFHAQTTAALLEQQLGAQPPRPRSINPGLPGPVEEVVLRGLSKDPNDRFTCISDFGLALTEAVERTRGIALESKMAAAAAIAALAGVLAITLVAPLLLALLPVGDVLGRFPLAWPFQLLLAALIAGLLLGIRWHVIGLVGRAVGAAIDSVDRLSRAQVHLGTDPAGSPRVGVWRAAAIAGVEGLVNLA
jgi:tRNA A-37 threonylcarbamoyl transferase component Bud32